MKTAVKVRVVFWGLWLLGAALVSAAYAESEEVQAKIAIKVQSGQRAVRAKTKQILRPGDRIRVYVHPLQAAYVYVVHADQEKARLLNMTQQRLNTQWLCLPSPQTFYQVDGADTQETITVVCSPKKLPKLSRMVDTELALAQWSEIAQSLKGNSQIFLARKGSPAFEIAGNTRGLDEDGSFVQDIPIFTGNGMVVQTYRFHVKK